MVAPDKELLASKLRGFLNDYDKILLVTVDNVGSTQFAQIRFALRGKAHVLKCKNTMVKSILKQMIAEGGKDHLNALLDIVGDNMAFVFCIDPIDEVRSIILQNRVPAPAKAGVIAPCSVTIEAGPTQLEPSMTSFFQALGIATKIVKAKIEILSNIEVVIEGQKVGASEATLLHKMNIMPFSYGFATSYVFDAGNVYPASVLDITDEVISARIQSAIKTVAAFGRATGLPSTASVPHSLVECFKNCAALSLSGFPATGALGELVAKVQ